MKTLQRYVSAEVTSAVFFVLVAFLALFAFFDLMGELADVGRSGYKLQHAFIYVLMGLPGYTYELMPIAVLIGTIYTLAQLASRSEFTIMRVSSMSTWMAWKMLAKIGVVFTLLTFLFGEFISPIASQAAERWKLRSQGGAVVQEFRTGLWTKDVIRANGVTGDTVGSRFLNVREVRPDGQLRGVRIYEFDRDMRLKTLITADIADYEGEYHWRLQNVLQTQLTKAALDEPSSRDLSAGINMQKLASRELVSEITPDILSVLFADPDRMSAQDLAAYTRHLAENKQNTGRYEIAFWKKIVYPFAVFVMLALALPFAYLHFRSGGVSLKIFIGIMIGVSFQLLNSLFSHIGLLNTWPALATAMLPSLLFMLLALGVLWWVQRT